MDVARKGATATHGWITNLQKPAIKAWQSSAEDRFAKAETASHLDDDLCYKEYSPGERAKCFKILEKPVPPRPEHEVELPSLEEVHRRQNTLNWSLKMPEEVRVDPNAKKDKRLKK